MNKYCVKAFLFILFISLQKLCSQQYGYISYSVTNIGDDIQSIAAKNFLPQDALPIDREFIGVFNYPCPVRTILNGWYMHTKDFAWYRTDVAAPEKSWPPASVIDPLIISIHFTDGFLPTALSEEGVAYLKKHAPIGARDYFTLSKLQEKGIPSYFSGCLTLTLPNHCKERDNIIYLVDLSQECVNYIKSIVKSPVKVLTHQSSLLPLMSSQQRLHYAENLLNKYRRAKCVVTCRLHASMPCLAFQTPVLLVGHSSIRFEGLKELVRHCTPAELLQGQVYFDFDNPQPNPTYYLQYRQQLINSVEQWIGPTRQTGLTGQ